ncbi:MAG: O-antigen ligase family protein [Nitrospira sp.]|nr:O-antigen ligase family protein [bacterium]MBL7047951.1 O-antigen ligase family protein [Nitrospira sp.]
MHALALIPGIIATLMLTSSSPEKVFLYLVLPMLLAVPSYYYFPLPGLPDLNFFHFAALPLFLWWLQHGIREYKYSFIDLFVFSYVIISIISEFTTMGTKDGINIIIDRFVQVIIPYLLTKHFFQQPHLRVEILKVMVAIGAILALLSPVEFRLAIVITDPLQYIWPDASEWSRQGRWGFIRVAATYGHPILAGLMWSFFALFAIWLNKQKAWQYPWVGKAVIILNFAGMAMAMSRGPILGFLAGLVILFVGWSKKRLNAIIVIALICFMLIPPAMAMFLDYIHVDRLSAKTETQESAAYRKELLDNYIDVIKKKLWLGHGRQGIPVVGGQKSVDNQYLFISLLHGVLAMYLFVAMTIFLSARLLYYGWTHPPDHKSGQLAWMLTACAGTWFITLATVYMGGQSEQVVFMLAAMASTIGYEKSQGLKMTSVPKTNNIYGLAEWEFQRIL